MLRRILQNTPGSVGSQGSDLDSSAAPVNAVEVNNESSSEGFICPQCMKSHGLADELFKHYEAVHDDGHGGEANLASKRDDITLLRQEVQDLQASLKEEKWYSEELKKELEKLQRLQQQEVVRERQENLRLVRLMQDKEEMIGKLKEEIDLLNRNLDDIEDENEQLKQENKTLLKVVGQLTR